MNKLYIRFILVCYALAIFNSCNSNAKNFSSNEITIKNSKDGILLSGTLTTPINRKNVPAVILVHGSGPMDRDLTFGSHKLFRDLAEYLSDKGIAVLRYDKRGVGCSKGKFIPYDLESFKNDGIAGVEFLKTIKEIDKTKIGVIGISEGGLVVPMMALDCPDISFTVLLGSPGIWGRDFFYASQLAMTRAAGFNQTGINEMTITFDSLWPLLVKDRLSYEEENRGAELLNKLWSFIDLESRTDMGFTNSNVSFWLNQYRGAMIRKYYSYNPAETLSEVKCPVFALSGDKDVQAVSHVNLAAIEAALKKGKSKEYKVFEIKDHNHVFQVCKTGKCSEYKSIKGTMSAESLALIEQWIKSVVNKK